MAITVNAVKRARRKPTNSTANASSRTKACPLESMQAMQSMARAEALNLRAVTDHNLAQLKLLVATGGEIGAKAASK